MLQEYVLNENAVCWSASFNSYAHIVILRDVWNDLLMIRLFLSHTAPARET